MAIDRPLRPASSSAARVDAKTGLPTSQERRWQESIKQTVDKLVAANNAAEPWAFSVLVQYPEDGSLTVVLAMPYAVTITSVTTKCTTGTATLTVKINSTALGGTANAVSTSEVTQAHSSANAMAAGDDLVFTFSAVSSAENVSVTVSGTVG
jgi:hypothetical protein